MNRKNIMRLVYAAVCLALAQVLPLITGNIPTIGKMLCPMHIPAFLAGFLCGPVWGMVVGFFAPLLRSLIFNMPALPDPALSMAFELMTYAAVAGVMNKILPKKPVFVWVSLITAMISGRVVWGIVKWLFVRILGISFGWEAFVAGAFLNAIPGIISHLILVPVIVIALRRAGLTGEKK